MRLRRRLFAVSERLRRLAEGDGPVRRDNIGELARLFAAEGTDKTCYAEAYEVLFAPRRLGVRNLLEIGIGTLMRDAEWSMTGIGAAHYRPGGSLRAWRSYFPHASIVGIDVQPDTQFSEDRICTALCDSTDALAVRAFLQDRPLFDLVIDDGSHRPADQLATLKNLLPAVAPGGLYIIEDIDPLSPLYRFPQLIEPTIGEALYLILDFSSSPDPGKNIVVQAAPAA